MKILTLSPEIRAAEAARHADARGQVLDALKSASARTGADFGYLLKTAMRESSLNPEAKASTSSATGLFQFIEQTWLATVKRHGATHGLESQAAAIEMDGRGRYRIADQAARKEILALRSDASVAATMAGAFTRDLESGLQTELGRRPAAGEIYAAHVLGLQGAVKLIETAQSRPESKAATLFPAAADANRSIFYEKSGTARSATQVLAQLTAKHGDASLPPAQTAPVLMATAAPMPQGSAPEALRGGFDRLGIETAALSAATGEAFVLSPVMVQILAAMDDASIEARRTQRVEQEQA